MRTSFVLLFLMCVALLFGSAATNSNRRCIAPHMMCATRCVNTQSDRENCGACGNICPEHTHCRKGQCICNKSKNETETASCPTPNQCQLTPICDRVTGTCVAPNKPNGTPCNDDNVCTLLDVCMNGQCVGTAPIVCTPSDQCHQAGSCNPQTGLCSNPDSPNGTPCTDTNLCTLLDTCQGGVCTSGTQHVNCTALDQCHSPGVCNPDTGVCSNPIQQNGSPCQDANLCTSSDTCQDGVCTSGPLFSVLCEAIDQCHVAGICNPTTGICSNPPLPNGSACFDGDFCTLFDACQNGLCTSGSQHVQCTALDQCHDVGICQNSTGLCSQPAKPNGSPCQDANLCTSPDTCQDGICTSGPASVICAALDQCHVPGVCNATTGACSNPELANGTPCNDENLCTAPDSCQHGACVSGPSSVVCTALDQCHSPGVCVAETGVCTNVNVPDGTLCIDSNLCTISDTCQEGSCISGVAVNCSALDQCHTAGVCNPTTGICSNPINTGAACNDSVSCTVNDMCNTFGVCVGTVVLPLFTQQGGKLVGSGKGGCCPNQGWSVSTGVSADGGTVAIGGPHDEPIGAVWIFKRSPASSTWFQQGSKLFPSDHTGPTRFGFSLSLSQDGTTLAVGGPEDRGLSGSQTLQGAVWIFTRDASGVWSQQGSKLIGSGRQGSFSRQGASVSLSADGNTVASGGWADNNERGAVWIFTRNALGIWSQQGNKLVATPTVDVSPRQGWSVSLSADGHTLASGAPLENAVSTVDSGAVWIFVRNPVLATWSQQAKLGGTGATTGAKMGFSVSLSGDGNTLSSGGPFDNSDQGAVWMFIRDSASSTWSQQGSKLVGSGAIGAAQQGTSVTLAGIDGNTLVIGGPADNDFLGGVWHFNRNISGAWSQQGSKVVGSGATGGFVQQGYSVSVSFDGGTLAVGGPYDASFVGATWIFTRPQC